MLDITNADEFKKYVLDEVTRRLSPITPEFVEKIDKEARRQFRKQFDVGGMTTDGIEGVWPRAKAGTDYGDYKLSYAGHLKPMIFNGKLESDVMDSDISISIEDGAIKFTWSWFTDDPTRYPPGRYYDYPAPPDDRHESYYDYYQDEQFGDHRPVVILEKEMQKLIEKHLEEL